MNADGLPALSTLAVKLKSHHDSLFKKNRRGAGFSDWNLLIPLQIGAAMLPVQNDKSN